MVVVIVVIVAATRTAARAKAMHRTMKRWAGKIH